MPRKKKTAREMTDKELARAVFPKEVRQQLKQVLAELNKEGLKPKQKAKKR
jgi:hypothetical protein